eukprot:CAMPEP_0184345596 /NCGR_PEP_ID=MMETSP1089-20130417/13977_1 /TAXON_ID=38269 ORGANISM="Gloeochaete wittrockiana, Strain SAG46.84" /NCGR_SAMPLE_ID=MMETSP1089 /ASSEMBLY_ACC=CAM_ASM_000445 /LENGTH=424 /DNA_ID=CAMNT_0026675947 /DNA_START=81 /DNA_END=1355 /DNA_ORIENTATION=-
MFASFRTIIGLGSRLSINPSRRGMAVVAATALIGTGAFFSQKSFLLAEEKSKFAPRSDSGFNGQKADETSEWKKKIFGNYENRIRELSSPEKVFAYFASQEKDGERFMTPEDFVRAITPYDPTSSNVGPGNSRGDSEVNPKSLEIFKRIDQNGDGLISFSEFIFYTTLLSIPTKYFSVAFRMFDEDGNGEIDQGEFRNIVRFLATHNPVAQAERSSALSEHSLSEIGSYPVFFGNDGKKKLTFSEFSSFITSLRETVLELQFNTIATGAPTITSQQFAISVVSYGNLSRNSTFFQSKIDQLASNSTRISLSEFKNFYKALDHIGEIDFALRTYVTLGDAFTKQDYKRAAKAVAGVDLTESQLDILFFIFDKDGDNKLDYDEFVGVMKGVKSYGLSKPRDLGVGRFFDCLSTCWKSEIVDRNSAF